MAGARSPRPFLVEKCPKRTFAASKINRFALARELP
jgi:hypothetical protein